MKATGYPEYEALTAHPLEDLQLLVRATASAAFSIKTMDGRP